MKFLLPLLFVCQALGANFVLDASRQVPWAPGVSGGIPAVATTKNVKTDYGAAGDGATDDYAAITNAIAGTTAGTALYFPAGTYLTSKILLVQKSLVLRGHSPTDTIILSSKNTGAEPEAAIAFGNDNSAGASPTVSSGGTRGSTSITLSSGATFSIGQYATMQETAYDPLLIFGHLSQSEPHALKWQTALVANVAGNVITLDRPLFLDYTNAALNPIVKNWTGLVTNAGIESITLRCSGSVTRGVRFYYAANCWATNCVATNVAGQSFSVIDSCRITIQRCQAINSQTNATSRYGFQVVRSTDCLVQDNISDLNGTGVLVQQGAAGNVVAYNYAHRGNDADPIETNVKYGLLSHGDFANFNLFEGNVVPRIGSDNFWGCNRVSTWFRNWAKGWMLNQTNGVVPDNRFALNIDSTNYYCNLVGNILGYPATNGITELALGWDEQTGDMVATIDPSTALTALVHGNYSFETNAVQWAGGYGQTLPSSYYLSGKPNWFGNLAWPPIGPEVWICTKSSITNTVLIPAQARFLGVDYTSPFRIVNLTVNALNVTQ